MDVDYIARESQVWMQIPQFGKSPAQELRIVSGKARFRSSDSLRESSVREFG